ncbi:MAG: phenylalanine--tRNA ligase subunit beta, partial [Bacteroidota bacterium]
LVSKSFFEILSNSLTNPKYEEHLSLSDEDQVKILNPLSGELSVMRQSLIFSGLEAVAYNINRKRSNLRLFEFGKTYKQEGEGHQESSHLSVLLSGDRHEDSWILENRESDFYFLRAVVEAVIGRLGISGLSSEPLESTLVSEGLAIYRGKTLLASIGVVDSSVLQIFDIKQEVLYADLEWDQLVKLAGRTSIVFDDIPKYPEVKRDFALLIDDNVTFRQIHDIAVRSERKLLKNVSLFDVYTGKNLPEGKKSYAVSFTLQDKQKTLTDKQIDKIMNKLQKQYESELGAELR